MKNKLSKADIDEIVKKLPVGYNPEAKCPRFFEFLGQTLRAKDIQLMQEIFGSTLSSDSIPPKRIIFLGSGWRSRATILDVLKHLHGKDDIASFDFESLRVLPEAPEDTLEFYDQWIIIRFPSWFEDDAMDQDILLALTTKKELEGILSWSIEGQKRLREQKHFSNHETPEEIQAKWHKYSNPLGLFVEENISITEMETDCIDVDELIDLFMHSGGSIDMTESEFNMNLGMLCQNASEDYRIFKDENSNWKSVKIWRGLLGKHEIYHDIIPPWQKAVLIRKDEEVPS